MKKTLIYIIILQFNLNYSQDLIKPTVDFLSISDFNIGSNVIKCEEKSYLMSFMFNNKFKPAKQQNKLTSYIIRDFNNKGLLTKQNDILKNKSNKYSYDDSYRLTKVEFNDGFRVFKYNINNQVVVWKHFRKDSTIYIHSSSKYNVKGKIIESKTYFNFGYGKIELINKYTYNDYNNLISSFTTRKEELIGKEENCDYIYDNNQNLIHLKCIDKTNLNITDKIFFYNDTLNIKKIKTYYRKGIPVNKYIYEYDNMMRDSVFTSYSIKDNKLMKISKKETTYNANGNVEFIKNYSYYKSKVSSKNQTVFKYKYDIYGNWLMKCYINNNNHETVTTRHLTYNNGTNSQLISKEKALLFCNPNYKEALIKFNNKKINIREKEIKENNLNQYINKR